VGVGYGMVFLLLQSPVPFSFPFFFA